MARRCSLIMKRRILGSYQDTVKRIAQKEGCIRTPFGCCPSFNTCFALKGNVNQSCGNSMNDCSLALISCQEVS